MKLSGWGGHFGQNSSFLDCGRPSPQLKRNPLGGTRPQYGDQATFALARAVTYATLFIGLVLVLLPTQILASAGVTRPPTFGSIAIAGLGVGVLGGALALWCILTFALVGKGTPAPFDPPRHLVIAGPYRFVRNPMYIGAGLVLVGAAILYRSLPLLGYAALFFLVTHLFVVYYEEPTLARLFGSSYQAYRASVGRWLPNL